MAHQSLYRRYRPQTFGEMRGQQHVVSALRSAVAEERTAHAYLFSGPRGTGKTTAARILAKALNCPNVSDGDPCGICESCTAIEQGKSFDIHELDAASHNKVDDVRDLISKVHLGTPGRAKVYILDEVHMLTGGAENALLKTLEEPPDHVVFVLATTEPHKVVATIRSRTQHFEFGLLSGDELADHVRYIIDDAGLDVDEAGIDYALARGGGSARDTLSALDLVAASGSAPVAHDVGGELADASGRADAGAAIAAIQPALEMGREPRTIGEAAASTMRDAFLAAMGSPLTHLPEATRSAAVARASSIGPATLTRALEAIGSALVDMRQAPDPRIPLEVAVLGLADRSASDPSALVSRIERLEAEVDRLNQALAAGAPAAPTASPPPSPVRDEPVAPAPVSPAPSAAPDAAPRAHAPADEARARLRAVPNPSEATDAPPPPAPSPPSNAPAPPPAPPRRSAPSSVPPSPSTPTVSNEQPSPAPAEPVAADDAARTATLDLRSVTDAMSGDLLEQVPHRVKARFKTGEFTSVEGTVVTYTVPNEYFVGRCAEVKDELEAAMQARFGQPVSIEIVVGADAGPADEEVRVHEDESEIGPVDELADADVTASGVERLTEAFPGSRIIEDPGP